MRVEDYAKYINVLHDLALVEDDLRHKVFSAVEYPLDDDEGGYGLAQRILFERFGVDR